MQLICLLTNIKIKIQRIPPCKVARCSAVSELDIMSFFVSNVPEHGKTNKIEESGDN